MNEKIFRHCQFNKVISAFVFIAISIDSNSQNLELKSCENLDLNKIINIGTTIRDTTLITALQNFLFVQNYYFLGIDTVKGKNEFVYKGFYRKYSNYVNVSEINLALSTNKSDSSVRFQFEVKSIESFITELSSNGFKLDSNKSDIPNLAGSKPSSIVGISYYIKRRTVYTSVNYPLIEITTYNTVLDCRSCLKKYNLIFKIKTE